jgi:hypothetical protein
MLEAPLFVLDHPTMIPAPLFSPYSTTPHRLGRDCMSYYLRNFPNGVFVPNSGVHANFLKAIQHFQIAEMYASPVFFLTIDRNTCVFLVPRNDLTLMR